MADVFDIALDDTLDLKISKGDFVVEESTLQHQNLLLITDKGQFRQHPTIGVGIDMFLNDEITGDEIKRRIQEQFEFDGMSFTSIRVAKGKSNLSVIAKYGPTDGSDTR